MEAPVQSLLDEIALLRRQLARERGSRAQAERLAEAGTRALYDRQSELALLAAVADAAVSSDNIEVSTGAVMKVLAGFGGWELGHVYLNEPGSPVLVPLGHWYESTPGRFPQFKAHSERQQFEAGFGLPGRVLENLTPLLLPDIATEENFPRRLTALSEGLKCGYAFPIQPSTGGVAVMEFFSIRTHAADEPMMQLVGQIAIQVGPIFSRHWVEQERRRAHSELEEKVRERTETLSRTVTELNAHIETQRRLQQSLQVSRRALDSAANGIVIADALQPHQPIVYCNPAFERLTGYVAGEVLGRNCKFLQGDGTAHESIATLREAIREGAACNVTIKNYRKDGSFFWNQLTVAPVRDAAGLLTHYVGIQEDVTKQHEVEANLRLAKDASEAANNELSRAARLKDEFLAAMSHELRTPLNAVLGISEIMREQMHGPLNPQQLDMIQTVEESGRHLLALINDILDLSKIEAGKLELQLEEVDIELTAQASVRFIKEHALKKRLHVSCLVNSALLTVQADHRRLKQILVNLLSNAVKFTPEGGRIGLEVAPEPSTQSVRFTVWDTGIGISAENLARLFKPFEQIDSKLSRRYEGTGLGLALVHRMAEMHGGKVRVTSTPGEGSRFTVVLPLARYSRAPMPLATHESAASEAATTAVVEHSAAKPPPAGLHVLVAEDNLANQHMVISYLETRGHRTTLATHGEDAVRLAREVLPDVILMDVQMPGMDGIEAMRVLRADPRFARTPIIALTALAMEGDRERCLAAGANRYFSKPVSLRTLALATEELAAEKLLAAQRP